MAIRGSVAGDLRRWQQRLPGFFNLEARRASRVMRDEIRDRTPIGERIDPDTGMFIGPSGELRRSITTLPVRRISSDRWVAGAESDLDYASHVEFGTRAHIITGNQHLRFWSNGQKVIVRQVRHPGTQGRFMFLRGAEAAERIYEQEARRRLQTWLEVDSRA